MSQNPNTQRGGLHAYTLKIAAGKTTKRTIRGTTIRVADAPYPVNITARAAKLNDQRGNAYTLEMKKFEKWFLDTEYDEVIVENPGAVDISVTLQLGYGDYEAEILSRTLAAPSVATRTVIVTENTIQPEDFLEVELWPENGQRKRITFNWNTAIESGAGILEVWLGPPGIATFAAIRTQALPLDASDPLSLSAGPPQDGVESTAALALYFVNVHDTEPVTITYGFGTFEELYSAS